MLIICENKTIPKTESIMTNMAYLIHVALNEKLDRLDKPDDEVKTDLSILDKNIYKYNYFGPYNELVQSSISTQVQCGFLERIYSKYKTRHELSEKGIMFLKKLKDEHPISYKYFRDIINICMEVTQLNPISLSSASLLYYYLKCDIPRTRAINAVKDHNYDKGTNVNYENGFKLVSRLRLF